MNGVKNVTESITFKRIVVVLRYIFLGIIFWSFYYSMLSIARKSKVGFIIGFVSVIIFGLMSGEVLRPGKLNNKEFGKHTNVFAFLIEAITFLCLFSLFGLEY